MTHDLLDAVDDLTKPNVEHVAQKTDAGKWIKAHTVTHPPLLQRMADAVTPSSNRTAGSAASAATRTPVDLDALFEYGKMTAAIGSWCRIVGIPTTRNPVTDLRAWYVARLALPAESTPEGADRFYMSQMEAWARTIRNHLDPAESFVADGLCPVCGGGSYGDAINGGDRWPIVVKYRLDDTERMTDEMALCRLCRVVWEGHDSIVELAEEMNERKAHA